MSLELDRKPRVHDHAGQRIASSVQNPQDWYPTKKRDFRWLAEGAKSVVVAILVLACGLVAWNWLNGRGLPGPLRGLTTRIEALANTEPQGVVSDSEGIGCFTAADGEYLVFVDDKGTENIVESPAQVPNRFRATVRCVSLKK